MSYILDALKRADLERERGEIPGLHAQPAPLAADDLPERPRVPALAWGGAAAIVLLAGAWLVFRPAPPPVAEPPAAALPPPPAAPVAEAPPVIALPEPRPAPPPPATREPAPAIAKAAPPAAPAAAADAGRILRQDELPDDIRRQLPPVAVGGSMYSELASNRMLIVNGRLLHEGDLVAPELSLDQIRLKSAVLRFKGYRYLIAY